MLKFNLNFIKQFLTYHEIVGVCVVCQAGPGPGEPVHYQPAQESVPVNQSKEQSASPKVSPESSPKDKPKG